MPPEPLPWDRKDFFKERKHERSESLGSVARWRDSSHHRDFHRWGSAEFRRPPGHGKQGGWHVFSEDSGHGYGISRSSSEKMLDEDCRPSVSRGEGKYGRGSRENRGPFGQRDWRGQSWETANGSMNLPRRPPDVNNNDHRSVDDNLTYSSHPHSDFVNSWDPHHLKDQHDKIGGANGFGTGPRCDRENSLASIDWKPLKWTRSGSLSSRGSGFSHSSSSRSAGAADSHEAKAELHPKNATVNESHSGEAAVCVTSSAPCEDTSSRKKPRLNWGEGLAKYEKKKVEVPDGTANKDGPVLSNSSVEPCAFPGSSLADKSPKVTGFSDCACASPATPSSVACSSSPGVDDKLFGKTANVDNDVSNLTCSPVPGSQDHFQRFSFNLEKLDIDSLNSLNSSIIELIQSDDTSYVNSGPMRSTAMNKLLIWKADISKVLETTESEIDSLENELKSLRSASADRCSYPAVLGSQLVGHSENPFEVPVGVSDEVTRPEPLKILSSDDPEADKMPLSTHLNSIHENGKEEDIDSPGSATSKLIEPPPLVKAVSSSDSRRYDTFLEDVNAGQSNVMKCLIPCTARKNPSHSACSDVNMSLKVPDSVIAASAASFCSSTEDSLYNKIISSNKELAKSACGVFAKLLPEGYTKIDKDGGSNDSSSQTSIMEKFAEKKHFARFKERVITLKFKALHHLWKEDMRLLSIKKCRPKYHKKHELSVRSTFNGNQKNRSSIRARFPVTAGNHLSLVPTAEVINFTRKLLSEPQVKIHRDSLKMPALVLDEKVSKFISSNGLVEDPLAIEKEKALINPWTSKEREIFLEKFAVIGKDFRKIASFLDHKTTADCVEFYYKNHKSECFEKLKKQKLGKSFLAKTDLVASGKKWNHETNTAELEMLNAASVMVGGFGCNKKMRPGSFLMGGYVNNVKSSRVDDSIRERSSSFDILGDERETFADVMASSEATSFCGTSSIEPVEGSRDRKLMPDTTENVDDETCSDESCGEMDPSDWTDDEKAAFIQAVSSFGRDFVNLARCVGTKSPEQCKVFFSKARKCLSLDLMRPMPENVGSPANDGANGGGSDTDDACVVETGSVVGTDKSGTKTDEDLPTSVIHTYHDESDPVEARNLAAELNEPKEEDDTDVDHENVNSVDNACGIKDEPKLVSDCTGVVLYSSDKSGSVNGQAPIIMTDSTKVGKDEAIKLCGADSVSISALNTTEPCGKSLAGDNKVVTEVSSGDLGSGLEGSVPSTQCPDDRGDKPITVTTVTVDSKSSVQDSCTTTVNASLSSVGNSCSGLSFDTESKHMSLGKPLSAIYVEDLHATANSLSQNTLVSVPVQCDKTATQDQLSCTTEYPDGRNLHSHNPISNGDHQLPVLGNCVDRGDSILHGYPLQMHIKKEVNGDIKCSSANELPLLSRKDEQDDHFKARLSYSSDSEKTSRNGDVKLFGKILTNPSATHKPNLTTKSCEENGIHNPNSSSELSSLKYADGNFKMLKFERDGCSDYLGLENVPVQSYGYWDGNRIQTGLSSLPDSAILLAKYPAAFSNYPSSSTKLEQQSFHAFGKNNERHLNGASAFTVRDMNGSNTVIDYQMLRSRDGSMVDVKHCQDVFSEMPRRNGFEAISSLHQQQQQARGVVGMSSGVGVPGIVVGGSCSGVTDPVAAIKMHYSNSDKYGGQAGNNVSNIKDESWAGGKGDLGR